MDKQTLTTYIATERARGALDADIEKELLLKGWAQADVTAALSGNKEAAMPSLDALLKQAWSELIRNIWKAFLIMLLPIGAAVGVGAFGAAAVMYLDSMMGSVTTIIEVTAVLALINLITIVASIMLMKQIAGNWTLSYGMLLRSSLSTLFPLLWVVILMGIAIIGGLMLLILPGIIITFWFIFAQAAAVIDGKKGVEALLFSRELVRGRMMKVVWNFFAAGLLVTVVSMILNLIPIIGVLASLITTPFITIFTVRFYQSLKALPREGEQREESLKYIRILWAIACAGMIAFVLYMHHLYIR